MSNEQEVENTFSTREGILEQLKAAFLDGLGSSPILEGKSPDELWDESDTKWLAVSELFDAVCQTPEYSNPAKTAALVEEGRRIGYRQGWVDKEAGRDPAV